MAELNILEIAADKCGLKMFDDRLTEFEEKTFDVDRFKDKVGHVIC